MCGIVGYVGEREATTVLIGGLRRLEYRGYDSAGVAVSTGATESVGRSVIDVMLASELMVTLSICRELAAKSGPMD